MILSSFLQFRRGKVRLIQAKLYYLPILVCELLTHMNKALYPTISVITASILLMWFTFYNGYPMATSDTGAYVRFAFDFQVLKDRSSFYSIWLAVAGLRSSLWLPVFFSMSAIGHAVPSLLSDVKQRYCCKISPILSCYSVSGIYHRCIFYSSVHHARYICRHAAIVCTVVPVR